MLSLKHLTTLAVILSVFVVASPVLANEIAVKPTIVDEQTQVRGIIDKQIQITNTSKVKVSLYPFVNDIRKDGGKQPFDAYNPDKTAALANWIDFSRKTIELMPGEKTTVPLKIMVHPQAKPGKYYAVISLINGVNRPDAEARLNNNIDSQVQINLEVKDNKVERAEVGDFNVLSFFNFNKEAVLTFAVKNTGNQPLAPAGTIVVYDSRGREVNDLKVNEELRNISPDDRQDFKISWPTGNRLGKFKAKLALQYGEAGKRDLQDSVYFWVLPKWFLGAVALMLSLLFISVVMLFLRLGSLKRSLIEEERDIIINLRDR